MSTGFKEFLEIMSPTWQNLSEPAWDARHPGSIRKLKEKTLKNSHFFV
jgi:hypothetical protein